MKILGYLLFFIYVIIGGYIYSKYGFGTVILYCSGALCLAFYTLLKKEEE